MIRKRKFYSSLWSSGSGTHKKGKIFRYRRFYLETRGKRQCLCLILKMLLSGIYILIDGFNVFVFQNPLINLFRKRKRFDGRGFDHILRSFVFVCRWNISIDNKSNICFCLFFLISRKIQKRVQIYQKDFLLILQIR